MPLRDQLPQVHPYRAAEPHVVRGRYQQLSPRLPLAPRLVQGRSRGSVPVSCTSLDEVYRRPFLRRTGHQPIFDTPRRCGEVNGLESTRQSHFDLHPQSLRETSTAPLVPLYTGP